MTMTMDEIRRYLAGWDGSACGKPWTQDVGRGTTVEGVCDYPAKHDGECGLDQDRNSPWVAACRLLLDEVYAANREASRRVDDTIHARNAANIVPHPRTVADVVAWVRRRAEKLPEHNSIRPTLVVLAN